MILARSQDFNGLQEESMVYQSTLMVDLIQAILSIGFLKAHRLNLVSVKGNAAFNPQKFVEYSALVSPHWTKALNTSLETPSVDHVE